MVVMVNYLNNDHYQEFVGHIESVPRSEICYWPWCTSASCNQCWWWIIRILGTIESVPIWNMPIWNVPICQVPVASTAGGELSEYWKLLRLYLSEICLSEMYLCQLQTPLVVNYPNIGRNFLLSADHRLPHYPQFPSQQMWLQASDQHTCDYCSCSCSSLVWLQLQHFHQGVITGWPQCTQYQRKYGPRATRQMLVVDYKRWNGW